MYCPLAQCSFDSVRVDGQDQAAAGMVADLLLENDSSQ